MGRARNSRQANDRSIGFEPALLSTPPSHCAHNVPRAPRIAPAAQARPQTPRALGLRTGLHEAFVELERSLEDRRLGVAVEQWASIERAMALTEKLIRAWALRRN